MGSTLLATTLFFIVAEPDPSIEWAHGFEAFQRGKGPGKGASRSHGWLAARAELDDVIAVRNDERYEVDYNRFGC